ncbi:DUF4435 domain-containing protein [Providencia manganoxydans]|uniref:DUF4435 domain-containing protein n=1 Tax=Providencia manganoxydans TaxID=2923283 RepID=UPI0032D9C6CA
MSSLRDAVVTQSWFDSNFLLFKHEKSSDKVFFLVEGISDVAFFKKILKRQGDRVYISSPEKTGKREVIDAVKSVKDNNYNNIYGICDSDFEKITGSISDYEPSVFLFTDFHDLEITMLSLDIFYGVFLECTKNYSEAHKFKHEEVLHNVFDVVYQLGVLKFINMRDSLKLNFKALRHGSFIEINGINCEINIKDIIIDLIPKSNKFDNSMYSVESVYHLYNEALSNNIDKLHICNGHDFCEVLALVNHRTFQNQNINSEKLETMLRLSCSEHEFMKTELYSHIKSAIATHLY